MNLRTSIILAILLIGLASAFGTDGAYVWENNSNALVNCTAMARPTVSDWNGSSYHLSTVCDMTYLGSSSITINSTAIFPSSVRPTGIFLWQNFTHQYNDSITLSNVTSIVNSTGSCYWGSGSIKRNATINGTTRTYCFDWYQNNSGVYNLTYTYNSTFVDWQDISSLFKTETFGQYKTGTVEATWIQNQTRKFKFLYDAIGEGKFDIAFHQGSAQAAKDNPSLIKLYLDPQWNTTGGTVTYDGNYTVVTFLTNGTLNITGGDINATVLVVAGGGGGGRGRGGGGAAGGLIYNTSYILIANNNYTVNVGNGGLGSTGAAAGGIGQNSVFGVLTADGGGGGGTSDNAYNGTNGGSGGGASSNGGTSTNGTGGTGSQGYNGGAGWYSTGGSLAYPSGGGGGSGGAGQNPADKNSGPAGAGGLGTNYTINGSTFCFAGGGGGSSRGAYAAGGSCGGGNGGNNTVGATATGYGSGGGGGGLSTGGTAYNGGNGSSGVVIIRYLTLLPNQAPVVSSLSITPTTNYFGTNTNFTATFNCTDADSAKLNATLQWFKNGTNIVNTTFTNFDANSTQTDTLYWGNITAPTSNFSFGVNCTDGSASSGYNYSANVTMSGQTNVFNNSIPADLDSINGIGGYTLHFNTSGTNQTEQIYLNTTTVRPCGFYVNGTCFAQTWQYAMTNTTTVATNQTNSWSYQTLADIYLPATYNWNETDMYLEAHAFYTLGNNKYVKIELENVSNNLTYGLYEINLTYTGTPNPLKAYYCNSTYSTGDPSINANCVQFGTIGTGTSKHTHSVNSGHYTLPVSINITTNKIGSVVVTGTSYFLVGGAVGWDAGYITNTSRGTALAESSNNGGAWGATTYTADSHLHQFSGTENISTWGSVAYSNGTYGVNSSVHVDQLGLGGVPPTSVQITTPSQNGSYSVFSSLAITYTAASSPNGYPITFYNITLLNSDYTFNKTIQSNNSVNLTYTWTPDVPPGNYIIAVNATDNNSLSSISYQPFIINGSITNCSSTVTINKSGTYMIENNMTAPETTDCIKIQASNIILNCQNFELSGPAANYWSGIIFQSNVTNATAQNCVLNHFATGIAAEDNLTSAKIYNITINSTVKAVEIRTNGANISGDNITAWNGMAYYPGEGPAYVWMEGGNGTVKITNFTVGANENSGKIRFNNATLTLGLYSNFSSSSINATAANIILNPDWVSMSSTAVVSNANITLNCSGSNAYIYYKAGFPGTKAAIDTYNRTEACIGGLTTFNVSGFSGYYSGLAPIATFLNTPTNGEVFTGTHSVNFTWTVNSSGTFTNELSNLTIDGVLNVSDIAVTDDVLASQLVNGFSNGLHNYSIVSWNGTSVSVVNGTLNFTIRNTVIAQNNTPTAGQVLIGTHNATIGWQCYGDLSSYLANITLDGNATYQTGLASTNNTPETYVATSLSNGAHTFTIQCYNGSDYNTTAASGFTIRNNVIASLNAPTNNTNVSAQPVSLNYTCTGDHQFYWADLYIDNVDTLDNLPSNNNTLTTTSILVPSLGQHDWKILCRNGTDQNFSALRYFNITSYVTTTVTLPTSFETTNNTMSIGVVSPTTITAYNMSVSYNHTIIASLSNYSYNSNTISVTLHPISPLVSINTTNIPYEVNVTIYSGATFVDSKQGNHSVMTWYSTVPTTSGTSYEDYIVNNLTLASSPPLAVADPTYTPSYAFTVCNFKVSNRTANPITASYNGTCINSSYTSISPTQYRINPSHLYQSPILDQTYYMQRNYTLSFTASPESASSKLIQMPETNVGTEKFVWITNSTNGTLGMIIAGTNFNYSRFLNITYQDEISFAPLSIDSSTAQYVVNFNDGTSKTFSIVYNPAGTSLNNSQVYGLPNIVIWNISGTEVYSAPNYVQRSRFLNNAPTNLSQQQNVIIYMLSNSNATSTLITVLNKGAAVQNAYVLIQKYSGSTGVYINVDQKITNNQGQAQFFGDVTAFYKFTVFDSMGNAIYASAGPEQFTNPSNTGWQIILNVGGISSPNWLQPLVVASCYANNSTNSFTYTYSDYFGLTKNITFYAWEDGNDTPICNTTVVGSSASYTCTPIGLNFSAYTYTCAVGHEASPFQWDFFQNFDYRGRISAIQDNNIILLIAIIGLSAGGVMIHPSIGIGTAMVGLFALYTLGYTSFPLSAITGFMVVGFILAYVMLKEDEG